MSVHLYLLLVMDTCAVGVVKMADKDQIKEEYEMFDWVTEDSDSSTVVIYFSRTSTATKIS